MCIRNGDHGYNEPATRSRTTSMRDVFEVSSYSEEHMRVCLLITKYNPFRSYSHPGSNYPRSLCSNRTSVVPILPRQLKRELVLLTNPPSSTPNSPQRPVFSTLEVHFPTTSNHASVSAIHIKPCSLRL